MSIDVSNAGFNAGSIDHKVRKLNQFHTRQKVHLQPLGRRCLHGRHKVAILIWKGKEGLEMPWQAQLFIGVRVHDKLGCHVLEYLNGEDLDEALWEDPTFTREIVYKGERREVEIFFRREVEGGCDWPVRKDEPYSDAIVGFALTSRYAPAILDEGHIHGRPEPFEFDAQAIVDNKLTLKEWLLVVARGFTPLLEMRDDPMGVEIPEEFPVSTHHKEGEDRATKELLEELTRTTDEQLLAREKRENVKRLAEAKKELKEAKEEHAICANMMSEVAQWNAPEELTNLKSYMMEMLNDALSKYDMVSYYENEIERVSKPVDVAAIRKVKVECLERSIQYHKEGYEEEVEGRKQQRKWLKALHEATR